MLTGLSHVTLGVKNLKRSKQFYTDLCEDIQIISYTKDKDCHLLIGDFWLALSQDSNIKPIEGHSHLAFSVPIESFEKIVQNLKTKKTDSWQENQTFGSSFYFLDPDGHKLEIHTSDWRERFGFNPIAIKAPISIFLEVLDNKKQVASELSVSGASKEHIDQICEIEIEAHRAERHSGVHLDTAQDIDSFKEALERIYEKGKVFLGFKKEIPIAFIAVSPAKDDPITSNINMLATHPKYRNLGISTALMQTGAEWLQLKKCHFIQARTYNVKLIQRLKRSPLARYIEGPI